MSLSYYYRFTAPAETSADELATFLRRVEKEAQRLGFEPTAVLNVPFDTPERRQFARRLTTGLPLQDERLKGVAIPESDAVWDHDPHGGTCHLLPERGAVLVVTDNHGCETVFGFFKFAESVTDIQGRTLAETRLKGRWHFQEFLDSPDPRFRAIVKMFRDAGFVKDETDEYRPATAR
jgi:hypothetical protein